ncbi:hypothetical protein [Mucilaginibacter flavus]|uniref:hypothetical protein n=1 Tax=Mucilaginibacter flavus TaxID=931504 RepID=UPI0025B3D71E|nr:hypothetical protein [Mucilaginibacter flavus]MDN3584039.1 hypothetical protein [Mucilaginibacter flavus]
MKTTILTLVIICLATLSSIAQSKHTGTWVVESNLYQRGIQTVNFYDGNNQLIYSETVKAHLNLSKKKVQQKLNNVLETLVAGGKPVNDSNMIVALFRIKRY